MRAVATGRAVMVAVLAAMAPATASAGQGGGGMLERPLFAPTRRPPPTPSAALEAPLAPVPAAPLPVPDVALTGIIVGPGGTGVALMRGPRDAEPVRVRPGGQVDGWTVGEIRPRAVLLRRDGRSVTVALPVP